MSLAARRWSEALAGRRTSLVAALGVLIAVTVVTAGCGGPPPGGGTKPSYGSVDGYVFKPAAASRGLSRLWVRSSGTPPPGYVAAAGAAICVRGTSTHTQSDSRGHFYLGKVSTGRRVVTIALAGFAPVTVTVSVTAGVTTSIADSTLAGLGRKAWTVLLYVCGDNDLEAYADRDINEMEQAGSSADVNIVVQVDRASGGASRLYVEKDDDTGTVTSPVVEFFGNVPGGEIDMGDARTLADFVSWGTANYPADRFMLVVWNHGSGWKIERQPVGKAIAYDDTSGTAIDIDQLADALSGLALDIIGMDACAMGMAEVAYELRSTADYLVASEELEPAAGWAYHRWLDDLVSDPAMGTAELGRRMIVGYQEAVGETLPFEGSGIATLSCTDLSALPDVADACGSLAAVVDEHSALERAAVAGVLSWAAGEATKFTDRYPYRDLYVFAKKVDERAAVAGLSEDARLDLRAAAQEIMTAVDGAVTYRGTYTSGRGDKVHGLSVFLPSGTEYRDDSHNYDVTYPMIDFTDDTSWQELFDYITLGSGSLRRR